MTEMIFFVLKIRHTQEKEVKGRQLNLIIADIHLLSYPSNFDLLFLQSAMSEYIFFWILFCRRLHYKVPPLV